MTTKKCPGCKEAIIKKAIACPHCGHTTRLIENHVSLVAFVVIVFVVLF